MKLANLLQTHSLQTSNSDLMKSVNVVDVMAN